MRQNTGKEGRNPLSYTKTLCNSLFQEGRFGYTPGRQNLENIELSFQPATPRICLCTKVVVQ